MPSGGKRLKKLIKERGFTLIAVAKAIDVTSATMRAWTTTAPIDKLIRLSDFTGIPLIDVVESFRPEPSQAAPTDRTGGEENN
jgi:transcriptional regulator with XRE-family HTH domain